MKFIAHRTKFETGNKVGKPKKKEVQHQVFVMESNGRAAASLYWFEDEPNRAILSDLTVTKHHRKKGIGLALQEYREQLAKLFGCDCVSLWVKKNSWMHKWYVRRGYTFQKKKDKDNIWLQKDI